MIRRQGFGRFKFNNYLIFNQNICEVTAYFFLIVVDFQEFLLLCANPHFPKFDHHSIFVYLLQEAKAKSIVYSVVGFNDLAGQIGV